MWQHSTTLNKGQSLNFVTQCLKMKKWEKYRISAKLISGWTAFFVMRGRICLFLCYFFAWTNDPRCVFHYPNNEDIVFKTRHHIHKRDKRIKEGEDKKGEGGGGKEEDRKAEEQVFFSCSQTAVPRPSHWDSSLLGSGDPLCVVSTAIKPSSLFMGHMWSQGEVLMKYEALSLPQLQS